jgi:hypothetical protein
MIIVTGGFMLATKVKEVNLFENDHLFNDIFNTQEKSLTIPKHSYETKKHTIEDSPYSGYYVRPWRDEEKIILFLEFNERTELLKAIDYFIKDTSNVMDCGFLNHTISFSEETYFHLLTGNTKIGLTNYEISMLKRVIDDYHRAKSCENLQTVLEKIGFKIPNPDIPIDTRIAVLEKLLNMYGRFSIGPVEQESDRTSYCCEGPGNYLTAYFESDIRLAQGQKITVTVRDASSSQSKNRLKARVLFQLASVFYDWVKVTPKHDNTILKKIGLVLRYLHNSKCPEKSGC